MPPKVLAIIIYAALMLVSCEAVSTRTFTSTDRKCRVEAVDVRTGGNLLARALATPHRFIDERGDCRLSVEDSNPSAIDSAVGPVVGTLANHVVVPVQ